MSYFSIRTPVQVGPYVILAKVVGKRRHGRCPFHVDDGRGDTLAIDGRLFSCHVCGEIGVTAPHIVLGEDPFQCP